MAALPLPPARSLADWQALAAHPATAAQHLQAALTGVPIPVRRAVLALERGTAELAAAWDTAAAAPEGPLRGVPVLVKDLFDEAGVPTRAGSTFLPEVRATPTADSALVRTLRAAGAVIAGRTHLNEFAYGLEGHNPHYGDVTHPTRPGCLSGGSSSGSAYAVAAGWVPLAFGTDTGGSIRVPAAYCGIYGLRLAPNAWSEQGCFPLAPTYDTAGWFTRTAADLVAALRALAPGRAALGNGRGLWLCPPGAQVRPDVIATTRALALHLGAVEHRPAAAALELALEGAETAYSVLQSTEALAIHRDWLDPYRERYDPLTWQRIERARHWTTAQLTDSAHRRDVLLDVVAEIFVDYDFIALPAVPAPSPTRADLNDDFRRRLLRLTCLGSLARSPALSLPVTLPDGITAGLQILTRDGTTDAERMLDQLAAAAEQS